MVDIIALCWNYERYLAQFVSSLQAQTDKDFRVLFYDNHSTDNSVQEAERLLTAAGIHYRMITRNRAFGISSNLNYVIQNHVASSYFASISVDDWLGPDYITHRKEYVANNPDTKVLLTNANIFTEEDGRLHHEKFDYNFLSGPVLEKLFLGNFLSAPGSFINYSFFRSIGGFDEAMTFEDWDMWIRVLKAGHKIDVIDDQMVFYRRHGKSVSARQDLAHYKAVKQTLDKHRDIAGYKKAVRNRKFHTVFYFMRSKDISQKEKYKALKQLFYFHPSYFYAVLRAALLRKNNK